MDNKYYLAIDIGASSGRHIVGWKDGDEIKTKEIYRFENHMDNQYSIWTWGGTDVTFEGCTFNTNGKAILLFGEEKTTNLTVNNCVFNDRNNGAAGKAAIEIGEANYGKHNNFTVVINGSTVASGFAAGQNTGSTLWANKNSMDAAHLTVTIDGTKVQ